MKTIKDRLRELGFTVPTAPKPLAAYIPAVKTGNLIFTAGQLPLVDGQLAGVGKVGGEISVEKGRELAEIAALNALAAVETITSIDNILRIIRVVGYVNGVPGFTNQPAVINGASELFVKIWEDAGRHARSAIGVAELPLNAPVEIELTVEIR
jgi:enamine deaminase RidA (YjgF/YER057c/UK114 family)